MLRVLFTTFLIGSAWCGFFDMMDVDDPLALLWNSRPTAPKSTECRANTQSGNKYGVCTSHSNCLLSGGASRGPCGILSTCCVFEKTCGKTSSTKVGYFEGNDLESGLSTCSYLVKLKNTNICQVRLDFVKFSLAPATTYINVNSREVVKCMHDRLKIHPNHYNIPDLCGNNDNQHVYVHVNQSLGVTKGVQLDITLTDRTLNPLLQSPSWKIKITQLECPGTRSGFNIYSDDYVQDFSTLAPLGAIQYFTETNGYIKSFGFHGSIVGQSYTYGQKYAIAFKRDIHTCGVRFTPEYINLPYDDTAMTYTDDQCHHYLFVPELHFEDPQPAHTLVSKVCLAPPQPNQPPEVFMSYAPGPLYVYFSSMKTDFIRLDSDNLQQGFNIKYELLSRCP